MELAVSYCTSCECALCHACVKPHQKCESTKCIEDALKEAQNTISSIQNDTKNRMNELQGILDNIPKTRNDIGNMKSNKSDYIEEKFNNLIEIIESRKTTILTEIDKLYNKELDKIDQIENNLKLTINALTQLEHTCRIYSGDKISSSMNSLLPKLKNRLEYLNESQPEIGVNGRKLDVEILLDKRVEYMLKNAGKIIMKTQLEPLITITGDSLKLRKFAPSFLTASPDKQEIFIYDGCEKSVKQLNLKSDKIKSFAAQRHPDEILVVNGIANNNAFIFLVIPNKNIIRVFSLGGNIFQDLGEEVCKDKQFNFGIYGGVATSKEGNLYIADYNNHRVHVYSYDLQFLNMIGEKQGDLLYPLDVAISNTSQVYVLHQGFPSISVYDANGNILATCSSINDMMTTKIAVTPNGEIILNSLESIFRTDAKNRTTIKISGANLNQPSDLTITSEGTIAVCDKLRSVLYIIT